MSKVSCEETTPCLRLALLCQRHHVLPYSLPFSAAAHGCHKSITYDITYSDNVPNAQPSDSPIRPFGSVTGTNNHIELQPERPERPAGDRSCRSTLARLWSSTTVGRSCCGKHFSCSPPALLFQSWSLNVLPWCVFSCRFSFFRNGCITQDCYCNQFVTFLAYNCSTCLKFNAERDQIG